MHWFDITVLVLAIISVLYGFTSGLIMQLALLVGIVLGGIFSGMVAGKINPLLMEYTNMQPHVAGPLSYVIAFILILVVICFVGKMIQSFLKAIKLNFINRLVGSVFSLVCLLFVVSIGLNLILELDRNKSILSEQCRTEAHTFPYVQKTAPYIIPYLRFDWIEELKDK